MSYFKIHFYTLPIEWTAEDQRQLEELGEKRERAAPVYKKRIMGEEINFLNPEIKTPDYKKRKEGIRQKEKQKEIPCYRYIPRKR